MSNKKLQAIFDKYKGQAVQTREINMLGHKSYIPDEEAAPLKELREEVEAAGYEFETDRVGGDQIIETSVTGKGNTVTALSGQNIKCDFIADFKVS